MQTTDEFKHKIKETNDLAKFIEENNENFISVKLADYLMGVMIEKDLEKKDIVKKSNLSLNYVYQIFNGRRNPQRDKVIMLAFGMELNLDETEKLLKIANLHILYAKDKRDSIILYSLHNKLSIIECNIELDKQELTILE